MLPGEEIIHVLPQEFKIDGQSEIKEPVGMYGGRLRVLVFTLWSDKQLRFAIYGRCIKSAGLELADLTLEPLASADAVSVRKKKKQVLP